MKLLTQWLCFSLMTLCSSVSFSAASKQESPVLGIGIVVEDMQSSIGHYHQLFNIQDWKVVDLNTSEGAVRSAQGVFKGKTIELLQPLYGKSLAATFLSNHGPGIFHLDVKNTLALKDVEVIEQASADKSHRPKANPAGDYQLSWFDSYADLGIYIKKSNRPLEAGEFWGNQSLAAVELPLQTARVQQLGIVVPDAVATAKEWQRIVGLMPWVFVDFKPPMTSNGQYRGAHGDSYSHVKIGYGQLHDLQIELLEPVAGPTPHRDYLRAYGQGAHHLSLGRLPEHDQLSSHYQSLSLPLQMQSDNGGEGRTATYIGTEAELGWVLEFTRAFTGLGTLKVVGQMGMPKGKQ